MRIFDLIGKPHERRTGKRIAVIGSCRVHAPFEKLAELGRARRVWANELANTFTFGEATQIIRYTLGEIDIPEHLGPFVFHPPGRHVRTALDRQMLNSADVVFVEIPEGRQIFNPPWYFSINLFYDHFVSKYGRAMLPWYRAFSEGLINDEIVASTLEKLPRQDGGDQEVVKLLLQHTRVQHLDATSALRALDEMMFDREKKWILVSPFMVPGLGGTQMEDRAKTINILRQVTTQRNVVLFDPSEMVSSYGREAALAKEGRDTYHYNPAIYGTLADKYLDAAGLTGESSNPETAAETAAAETERINRSLVQLHSIRIAAGVLESGLYSHYKQLLDNGSIAGKAVSEAAHLIAHMLPTFDRYHVLRAGLGELAFVLAALGLRVMAFDADSRRFEAMSAGFNQLCDEDRQIGQRLAIGRVSIPADSGGERIIAIATHLIGYTSDQEEQVLGELAHYSAVLIKPDEFLFSRRLPEDLDRVLAGFRGKGFNNVRHFPALGFCYCAKPDIRPRR